MSKAGDCTRKKEKISKENYMFKTSHLHISPRHLLVHPNVIRLSIQTTHLSENDDYPVDEEQDIVVDGILRCQT